MQRLRTSLPDTNSGVLLTATDEAACLSACEEARSLNTELLAMSGLLSEGEASHLQPLLAKLGQLARTHLVSTAGGEDEPAAAETKASDGSAQSIEPFARPLLDAVEHTTVQLLLAVQNLRQQSLQPPNTAAAESAVKEEDDEEDGGGTEQGSVLKHHGGSAS